MLDHVQKRQEELRKSITESYDIEKGGPGSGRKFQGGQKVKTKYGEVHTVSHYNQHGQVITKEGGINSPWHENNLTPHKEFTGKGMPTYNKETNQYKSGKENDEFTAANKKIAKKKP